MGFAFAANSVEILATILEVWYDRGFQGANASRFRSQHIPSSHAWLVNAYEPKETHNQTIVLLLIGPVPRIVPTPIPMAARDHGGFLAVRSDALVLTTRKSLIPIIIYPIFTH